MKNYWKWLILPLIGGVVFAGSPIKYTAQEVLNKILREDGNSVAVTKYTEQNVLNLVFDEATKSMKVGFDGVIPSSAAYALRAGTAAYADNSGSGLDSDEFARLKATQTFTGQNTFISSVTFSSYTLITGKLDLNRKLSQGYSKMDFYRAGPPGDQFTCSYIDGS